MRADDFFRELEQEIPELAEVAPEVDAPFKLARNVYRLRLRSGMTQEELARAARMSQPRIAMIERGDANPRLATIARLAHALGVSESDLLANDKGAVKYAAPSRITRQVRGELSSDADSGLSAANDNFALAS